MLTDNNFMLTDNNTYIISIFQKINISGDIHHQLMRIKAKWITSIPDHLQATHGVQSQI
jgi:hypothetical protein